MEMTKLETRHVGAALVIAYSGAGDFDQKHLTEGYLEEILNTSTVHIVLDMKKVQKFLSTDITHLIRLYRTLDKQERKLYLLNVPDYVMKVLSMVNVVGRFVVLHSEDELRQLFSKGSLSSAENVPLLQVRRTVEAGFHLLRLEGTLTEGADAGLVLQEVESALMQGAAEIRLDFSGIRILDTYSVGALFKIAELCRARGVSVKAVGANEVVSHVLRSNGAAAHFGL